MNYICGLVFCLIAVATIEARIIDRAIVIMNQPKEIYSMPESCTITQHNNMSFCLSKDNYPHDIVEKVVNDIKDMTPGTDFEGSYEQLAHRQGSEEIDCPSDIPDDDDLIYYVVDNRGDVRVVIQVEDKFIQRFTVRWCREPGPLQHKTEHFSNKTVHTYNIACENKLIHYDFTVLSGNKDDYVTDIVTVGIPIYCACTYKPE